MVARMKSKILIGPVVSPGQRAAVVRREDGTEATGLVRTSQEGRPLSENAECIQVDDCGSQCGGEGWHDMTTLYKHGPAQVATPAYRTGYDRIFGGRQKVGEA